MRIGIDSFVSTVTDPVSGVDVSPVERVEHLLEEVERADQVGLDTYGIGEHHRHDFMDSAPGRPPGSRRSPDEHDPPQQRRGRPQRKRPCAPLPGVRDPRSDLQGPDRPRRRPRLVHRSLSAVRARPSDYDSLFAEKLDLLLRIREQAEVTWSGRHRPSLTGQGIFPRPLQNPLPIWVGVGGTPESFVRAGTLGLPLMVAIIGGQPARFRPLVDLYREAGRRAGHPPDQLKVGLHCIGFVGDTTQQAADDFYPGWAQMFSTIGRERGFAPPNRAQYDAMCGPDGAYLIGDPQTVAAKILRINDDLGGISRISLQMTNVRLAHDEPPARDRAARHRRGAHRPQRGN